MLNEIHLEHLAAILSGDLVPKQIIEFKTCFFFPVGDKIIGEKVQENHQPVMCSCSNPQCSCLYMFIFHRLGTCLSHLTFIFF